MIGTAITVELGVGWVRQVEAAWALAGLASSTPN